MGSLHDDDSRRSLGRVCACAPYFVEPVERSLAHYGTLDLADVVRIVNHQPVAAFARGGTTRADGDTMAAAIRLHPALFTLIARELVAVAPVGLIPRALNQPPTPHVIAGGKRFGV